jgi:hypothetical protein
MHRLLTIALLFAAAPLVQVPDSTPAVLWALRLPALVMEAREAGITEVLVREVLDGLRRRGLPAEEAALVLWEEVDAVKAGESKDNFGAFVNRQLDAGLRGRALAEAIRAEHRAQGKGRPGRGTPRRGDTTGIEGRRP